MDKTGRYFEVKRVKWLPGTTGSDPVEVISVGSRLSEAGPVNLVPCPDVHSQELLSFPIGIQSTFRSFSKSARIKSRFKADLRSSNLASSIGLRASRIISQPGVILDILRRTISRIRLFARFLLTAFPTGRPATMPNRDILLLFGRLINTINGWA